MEFESDIQLIVLKIMRYHGRSKAYLQILATKDGNGVEESAATCDLFSGGRWLANAPSLPYGVKKAGMAAVEGKIFIMGGLITARDDNRYHATAKVKRWLSLFHTSHKMSQVYGVQSSCH